MDWHPKTIVAGVDGSDASQQAAERALAIARHWDAKLILATVVRQPEGWWGIGGAPPSPEALASAIADGQRTILNEIVQRLDLDGVDYETLEDLGDPTTQLIKICETNDADLLVIGRRGAGIAERVILGSVADRLCHHSPIPVLVSP